MSPRAAATLILLSVTAFGARQKQERPIEIELRSLNGERVRLSDYRGRIVVLNFWASWCGPCQAETPMLVMASGKWAPKGVQFIGASLDEKDTRTQVSVFARKYQVPYPLWLGATAEDLARLHLGNAVPDTVFLDGAGTIVFRIKGQIREAELDERLRWLTGARDLRAPEAVVSHLDN